MRLRFACRKCEATVATAELGLPAEVACPICGERCAFTAPAASPMGPLERCPRCSGPHLFLQKEFPRRLGLLVVVLGAALFLTLMAFERVYTAFGALLAIALLDFLIYRAAPLMTVCYHCDTEYRRVAVNPKHAGYDPKVGFYTAKKQAVGHPDAADAADAGAGSVRIEEAREP